MQYDFKNFNSGSLSDYEKKQILLKGRQVGKSQLAQAYVDAYNNMSSGTAKQLSNMNLYNGTTSPSKAQLKPSGNLELAKRAMQTTINSKLIRGTYSSKQNNLQNAASALKKKAAKSSLSQKVMGGGGGVGTWGTPHANLSPSATYHPLYSTTPRLGTKADLSNPPSGYNSYDPQSPARAWANQHFDLGRNVNNKVKVIPKKVEDIRAAELMTEMMNSDEMNRLRGTTEYMEMLETIYNMYGENSSI